MFLHGHLQDVLPDSDTAITSHLVKPETQQLECKSAFPDQKGNSLYIINIINIVKDKMYLFYVEFLSMVFFVLLIMSIFRAPGRI